MKQVPAGDSLATPTPVACVNVFVSERGNEFMRDIARALVEAAAQNGRQSTLVTDRLPEVDGSINLVVAPHEFFTLSDAATTDLQRAAAASVCVCTEQPGTPWFRLSVEQFDAINFAGIVLYKISIFLFYLTPAIMLRMVG